MNIPHLSRASGAARFAAASLTLAFAVALPGCGDPAAHVEIVGATQAADDTWSFQATVNGSASAAVHWTFGEGGAQDGATVTHAYAQAGDFTVSAAPIGRSGAAATRVVSVRFPSHVAGRACAVGTGWCWQNERVTAQKLTGSLFADPQDGWAWGEGGAILQTSDAGVSWSVRASGVGQSIASLRFSDADHGWAIAAPDYFFSPAGTWLVTVDGGATWRPSATPPSLASALQTGTDATIVAAEPGRLLLSNGQISVDGGVTWSTLALASTPGTLHTGGADCWSVGPSSLHRAAGCATSSAIDVTPPTDGLVAGSLVIDAEAFAATGQALVFGHGAVAGTYAYAMVAWSTSDGGDHWQRLALAGLPMTTARALVMNDAANGWLRGTASSTSIGLWRTGDGGASWTSAALPAALQPMDPSLGRFVAQSASQAWLSAGPKIGRTRDGGATWQVTTVTPETSYIDGELLQWSDDGLFATVRFDGRIHVTRDGGATWDQVVGGLPMDALWGQAAVSFTDAAHGVYALGNGAVRRTTDGGRTWSRSDTPVADLFAPLRVAFPSPATGWMVRDHALLRSDDGGANWTGGSGPAGANLLVGMSWIDASHGWVVDASAGVFATSNGGAAWTAVPAPARHDVAFISPLQGAVVDDSGDLLHTTDGGRTWIPNADFQPGGGVQLKASRGRIWAFAYGRVPRVSEDGGTTWSEKPVGFVCFDVAFADDAHGWLSCWGFIARTDDGGQTWTRQLIGADSFLMAIGATDRYTAWAVDGTGAVLATATGGL